ncbi:signal transducer [Cladophialophora carrionii]|uniref:Signal transducer n=1 Tax=Cladophialophora carrionii TaxID=86049 RepID=A0A1C1CD47_9EURO|nr:signal transducer [Cladophialophora carrionii]
MADDETMDDTPQLSDTDASDDESEDVPVESLVAGRERRKTAGNRYDRDMVLEETGNADDPDEVTLLFADDQEEEDDEFRSDADDEDADMSSSDDEDQGPNAAAEDLEGEKELQNQAKQERAKKRKADLALTSVAGVRKKLKTDPTRRPAAAASSAPSKPSKKKERVTWVHDENSGRSSLRKQTIAHREETIARLKESEAQSKKLKALKEKRDRERAKDAPRELTQADRLAEAARVERQNAKSLNRWEAMERKRQEEQAAKLAALKDRKLEGPVISWLSQKAKWVQPDPRKIATKDAAEPAGPKKRGRKSKAELELIAAEKAAESTALLPVTPTTTSISAQPDPHAQGPAPEMVPTPAGGAGPSQPEVMPPTPDEPQESFLMGIHEYANLQADSNTSESKPVSPAPQQPDMERDTAMKEVTQPGIEKPLENAPDHVESQTETPSAAVQPAPRLDRVDSQIETPSAAVQPEPRLDRVDSQIESPSTAVQPESRLDRVESETEPPTAAVQPAPIQTISGEDAERVTIKTEAPTEQTQPATPTTLPAPAPLDPGQATPMPLVVEHVPEPQAPQVEEDSTRNLVILEKFDELSSDARQEYSFFYNKKATVRTGRAVKQSQELCLITALPVRYRDPSTGIAYANAAAYKKLQELKEHKYAWSSMLGCYVGREHGITARGVPEGF